MEKKDEAKEQSAQGGKIDSFEDIPEGMQNIFGNQESKQEKVPTIKKLDETIEEKIEKQVIMEIMLSMDLSGNN